MLQEATRTIACVRMHSAQPDTSKAASRQTNEREKARAIGSATDSHDLHKRGASINEQPVAEERAARDAQAQPTGTPVPRSAAWLLAST